MDTSELKTAESKGKGTLEPNALGRLFLSRLVINRVDVSGQESRLTDSPPPIGPSERLSFFEVS